jgi:signal peptidase I
MKLKAAFAITIKVCLVIGLIFLVRVFVFSVQRVESVSMAPSLNDEDLVFVSKLSKQYSPGDIVVFRRGNDNFIKRVIAPPNSKVYVSDYQIYVNDRLFFEDFGATWDRDSIACRYSEVFTTGENEYFLMGDNRCKSSDSRDFGNVTKDKILGKIFFVL